MIEYIEMPCKIGDTVEYNGNKYDAKHVVGTVTGSIDGLSEWVAAIHPKCEFLVKGKGTSFIALERAV